MPQFTLMLICPCQPPVFVAFKNAVLICPVEVMRSYKFKIFEHGWQAAERLSGNSR